uniref:Uncharacterized protein n=1 Tax=Eubacterium plexicaudatum ASF492 TaxID=1235802 RepID=N2BKN9_9FIRM
MKTKQIPALVTLVAAFAMCIISYVNDYSLSFFIRTMFLVLVGFFILGMVIKIILDLNVSQLDEEFVTAEDLGFADGEIIEDMEFIEEEQES